MKVEKSFVEVINKNYLSQGMYIYFVFTEFLANSAKLLSRRMVYCLCCLMTTAIVLFSLLVDNELIQCQEVPYVRCTHVMKGERGTVISRTKLGYFIWSFLIENQYQLENVQRSFSGPNLVI